MAATVLVREVLRRASVLLQDAAFQRATESNCIDWFNDAQATIATFLPLAASRIDAIKLRAGTQQSIEAVEAADVKPGRGGVKLYGKAFLRPIRHMGADGLTPGRVVRIVDRDALDAINDDWHVKPGKLPVRVVVFDPQTPRHFYVEPGVAATPTQWLEIAWTVEPTRAAAPVSGVSYIGDGAGSGATAVIGVDDEHVTDLVNYMVARANMTDQEWANADKAAYFAGLFVSMLNAKVTAASGSNPNLQRLPLAPEPLARAS